MDTQSNLLTEKNIAGIIELGFPSHVPRNKIDFFTAANWLETKFPGCIYKDDSSCLFNDALVAECHAKEYPSDTDQTNYVFELVINNIKSDPSKHKPHPPTSINYMHVDHGYHHFTAIDQIIQTVKSEQYRISSEGDNDKSERFFSDLVLALGNTKRFGYEITKKSENP